MSTTLDALVDGRLMGCLIYDDKKDRLSFRYEDAWVNAADAYPLSLSMPLVKREHPDTVVRAFISGLLPDNIEVLRHWGKRFQVSAGNPFRLLEHVGEECAGAVQFVRPDHSAKWLAGKAPKGVHWIDDEELVERMQDLVKDHAAARRPGDQGQFSLAGAQPKMGLYRDVKKRRWGIPKGTTPTTHILKPNIGQFQDYDQNEHFCLTLASRIGLSAAKSHIETIGAVPVIVVERFDRVRVSDDSVIRVHQEDICQALGKMPEAKYEKDSGPSAKSIFQLIRDYSSKGRDDERRLLDALIFNWLILGTDAHAKNYGFLLAAGPQVRLAPLYDLSSWCPYEREAETRKTRLAMKVGGEYRCYRIAARNWEKAAGEWRLDRDLVFAAVVNLAWKIAEVSPAIAQEIVAGDNGGGDMLKQLADKIVKNAESIHTLFTAG